MSFASRSPRIAPEWGVKRKLKATAPEALEDESTRATGLCVTCSHAQRCTTIQGKKNMQVMYCELFDDYERPRPKIAAAAPNPSNLSHDNDPARKQLRGLCVTCSHLAYCTFTKPQGGVWHCEEYE